MKLLTVVVRPLESIEVVHPLESIEGIGVGRVELHSCLNHKQTALALVHRTVNPKVLSSIHAHDNFFLLNATFS